MEHEETFYSQLPDGTRVIFRPIRPDDKDRLVTAFESLSPEARYARFLRPVTRLSARQVVYLTEVDMQDHFAWVALRDEEGEPGIGVGRWIRLTGEPEVAEVAITVVDDFQRQGVGQTLLWLCALSAIERNVKSFRVWMLGENRGAMSLLRAISRPQGTWEEGVYVATVGLPGDVETLASSPPPLRLERLENVSKPEA